MNPTVISESIKKTIVDQTLYLRPVHVACPSFEKEYKDTIEQYPYLSSPYIEKIPYYAQDEGTTLASLAAERVNGTAVLEEETAKVFASEFGKVGKPDEVKLYSHQAEAVRDAATGKNLIICTGTGSGKTESFLIPAINAIIKERKEKGDRYVPGVRVMILYPMNALVNDQVRRLRSIIRHAVIQEIEYAKDITYGIYTSELRKRELRMDNLVPILNRRDFLIADDLYNNPFFSENESPRNEYTSRPQWDNAPADILITNYSMLEQLLLDPARQNIFYNGESPTWKFIILDEAHTYDGAVGTDIAWLIRRVVQRSKSAESLRFMATSATLVDRNTVDEKGRDSSDVIKEDFAARIFPAEPSSFSVKFGKEHEDKWSMPPSRNCRDFSTIFSNDISPLVKDFELKLKNLKNKNVKNVFGILLSSKSIVDYTKSVVEISKWLRKQHNLTYHYQSNLDEISWGDVYCLARVLQTLDKNSEITFRASNVTDAIAQYIKNNENKIKKNLAIITGDASSRAKERYYDAIKHFSGMFPTIKSASFCVLSELLQSGCRNDFSIAKLKLSLSDQSKQLLSEIKQDLNQLIGSPSNGQQSIFDNQNDRLTEAWNKALGGTETSYRKTITQYLLNGPELISLRDAVACSGAECSLEKVVCHVFPLYDYNKKEDKKEALRQFDYFAQLLTLSEHEKLPGKPLMDIRYHQTVSGISNMSIKFEPDGTGGYTPTLHPDVIDLADENGVPYYTFGICYACAQPYVFAYGPSLSECEVLLSRYKSEVDEKCYPYAFCWTPSNNEDSIDSENDVWYFNPISGVLKKSNNNPGDGYIRVYCVSGGDERRINQCKSCGEDAREFFAEYGILAPFKTGMARMKTGILYALIDNMDPDICSPSSSVASGRKLLAFSDSRASAARLAVNFDRFVEERLLETIIKNLFSCDALPSPMEYLSLFDENTTFYNSKNHDYTLLRRYDIPEIRKESNEYYSGSLLSILQPLKKELDKRDAGSIYEKESSGGMYYSEPASLSLCALAALRNTNRKGLLKNGDVRVFSYAQRKSVREPLWLQICDFFESPQQAESFFDELYTLLFLRVNLNCTAYDTRANDEGCSYINDTDKSLNGFSRFPKKNFADGVKFIANRNKTCFQRLLMEQYHFDGNKCEDLLRLVERFLHEKGILVWKNEVNQIASYELDLNDARFLIGRNAEVGLDVNKYYCIEEHTAQLSSSLGRIHQLKFSSGAVNILSCSTTFEMGVDLGNLNCVYLNNMPPTVSNYKQRAGRAGRRPGSSSYVLTLIGAAPHDLYYKDNPHELFFGSVGMPRIHIEVPTFKHRHLRAEALHAFLKWCNFDRRDRGWRTCGNFFDGQDAILNRLTEWRNNNEERENLFAHCCAICGVENLGEYHPADDICFQLLSGWNAPQYYYNEYNCLQLGGCHIRVDEQTPPDSWCAPLKTRYDNTMAVLGNNQDVQVSIQDSQITSYLAENGVLPKYGFPSDVIQLRIPENDAQHGNLSLSRDVRLGLFEYAPGMEVVAHKRSVKSSRPLLWNPGQAGPEMYQVAGVNRFLRKCNHCNRIFLADNGGNGIFCTCPHCLAAGDISRPINAIRPDAFESNHACKAEAFNFNASSARTCIYAGGLNRDLERKNIQQSNLSIAPSQSKSIIYINEKKDKKWPQVNGMDYDALVHTVRSEAALWSYTDLPQDWTNEGRPVGWDITRFQNAWESALQAILKAASLENKAPKRDLDGQVVVIDKKRYIVLFDSGSSASTSILKLIVSNDCRSSANGFDVNHAVEVLSYSILCRAYELCIKCDKCYKSEEGEWLPTNLHTVIAQHGNGVREHRACYNCIMSYDNQRIHSVLDAYDAAVILKAMLGNQLTDPRKDDNNPGPRVINNPPSGGKNEPASQTSSNGGSAISILKPLGDNRVGEDVRESWRGNKVQGGQPPLQQVNLHIDGGNGADSTDGVLSPPQSFVPLEGNFADMKNLRFSKGQEYWVRKDGKVFVDKLKRCLSDHRAEFEQAGKVAYADIMKK